MKNLLKIVICSLTLGLVNVTNSQPVDSQLGRAQSHSNGNSVIHNIFLSIMRVIPSSLQQKLLGVQFQQYLANKYKIDAFNPNGQLVGVRSAAFVVYPGALKTKGAALISFGGKQRQIKSQFSRFRGGVLGREGWRNPDEVRIVTDRFEMAPSSGETQRMFGR